MKKSELRQLIREEIQRLNEEKWIKGGNVDKMKITSFFINSKIKDQISKEMDMQKYFDLVKEYTDDAYDAGEVSAYENISKKDLLKDFKLYIKNK